LTKKVLGGPVQMTGHRLVAFRAQDNVDMDLPITDLTSAGQLKRLGVTRVA
jgi:hypothetical protein